MVDRRSAKSLEVMPFLLGPTTNSDFRGEGAFAEGMVQFSTELFQTEKEYNVMLNQIEIVPEIPGSCARVFDALIIIFSLENPCVFESSRMNWPNIKTEAKKYTR